MLKPLFDILSLHKKLISGTTILTPNRRLTAKIIEAFGQQQDSKAWACPRVYSIDDYALQCWQRHNLRGEVEPHWLLSPHQTLILWEQAIKACDEFYVSRPAATAKIAADAFNNIQRWQVDVSDYEQEFNDDVDCRAFLAWQKDFLNRCQRLTAFTPAMLSNALISFHQAQDKIAVERQADVVLVGFDVLVPQYQQLVELLFERVEQHVAPRKMRSLRAVSCDREEQQWLLCAEHFKRRLEENTELRLGLIVPELNQQKERVERCFMEVFEPQHLNNQHPRSTLPFNITAGDNLRALPVVNTAIDIIKLGREVIEVSALKRLLQSPFWQSAINSAGVHRLLRKLVAGSRGEIGASELLQQLQLIGDFEPAKQLSWMLLRAEEWRDKGRMRKPSKWLSLFQTLLTDACWPGPRPIDSVEFQQLEAFHLCLQSFHRLDDVSGEVGFDRALELLEAQLRLDVFQQQTYDGPIHILGALEGAGLCFDELWVSGMDDTQWPAAARPNPYLPIGMQTSLAMPHANASREYEVSRNLTESYFSASEEVICSFGCGEDESRLSMLFEQALTVPVIPMEQWSGVTQSLVWLHERIASDQAMTRLDDVASAITDASSVGGGSAIFKDQAACPFRAYAQHRLKARSIEHEEDGFSPLERGNGLHDALELIWSKLQGLEQLQEQSVESLGEMISHAAGVAVERRLMAKKQRPIARITALEQRRLERVLGQWMALEKQRSHFTIEALEHEQQVEFAGLPLTLRMDRVDRLNEGEVAIIDYKSGRVAVRDWLDHRLKEPQLPLYVCALEGQVPRVSSVLFGQVKLAACEYRGVSEHEAMAGVSLDNGNKAVVEQGDDWPSLVASWKQNLSALANDFLHGVATVDPKQADTCTYCDLGRLCRIAEVKSL
ncbi:putative DNA repair protein [Sinobacterium caligoides]|uniref:Putative DNA repair protein n=1 Tax=Sinobacterium caligoides TaxID=933926 RepID=A0A3N2DJM2_9GAMM|nr:PD-(D/E)XK nuclease family protein [Sinobacterium caligoides]ROS00004.1 putative DNA repair protein [Sinobacterium caligoides]